MNEILHAKAIQLIETAEALIPETMLPDLPCNAGYPDVPDWHKFEHDIWVIGEEIRQIFIKDKKLRIDKEIQNRILNIIKNRNAKRGRQSFILLFGYKNCSNLGMEIIKEIDDKFVDGHIISTIYKMKLKGYSEIIKPFINNKSTWIKKETKRYLEFDK